MIVYKTGNLLDDDAQVLVNTVNTVGVMGKGIALQFKKRYPLMFEEYREDCLSGIITIGRIWWWAPDYTSDHWIICFPTKQHWRNPSKLEWIESGLQDLREQLLLYTPKSIAIPKLGCANGGLNWEDVHPLIIKYLGDLEIEVRLYVGQNGGFKINNLNREEMIEKIPKGLYCYDENGRCPYWSVVREPINMFGDYEAIAYCSFIDKDDRDIEGSLLWDQCKECGIKMDYEE